MQTLLTVGERGIAAALAGRNTNAAHRLINALMQNDLVTPLLVATNSARTNVQVQESLLRLQLQKLRYQLAVHAQTHSDESAHEAQPKAASPRALDVLLPDSLLDDAGSPGEAALPSRPLMVMSTGMQPLPRHAAAAQLWQSLRLCMQPDAPLLDASASVHGSSGSAAAALASAVQQLAAWSAAGGEDGPAAWLPSLLDVLQRPTLLARLDAQMQPPDAAVAGMGQSCADWRALLAQPVACIAPVLTSLAAAAVSTGAAQRQAWIEFGDWLYVRVRRSRHARRGSSAGNGTAAHSDRGDIHATQHSHKVPLDSIDELGYKHVALAYARALALDAHNAQATDATRLLLRLLHFAIHHNTPAVVPALARALAMVPPATWDILAPQLFVQLRHSQPHVRTYAVQLLLGLARTVPASVLYTAVASEGAEHDAGIATLLTAAAGGAPARIEQCRALLHGVQLLMPLAAEAWQSALQTALLEVRRRVVSLKPALLRTQAPGAQGQHAPGEAALWERRYAATVAHGVATLQQLAQEWQQRQPQSPHESYILATHMPKLIEVQALLSQAPAGSNADRHAGVDARLQALEQLQQEVAVLGRNPELALTEFAPQLASFSAAAGLPVPGAGNSVLHFALFYWLVLF